MNPNLEKNYLNFIKHIIHYQGFTTIIRMFRLAIKNQDQHQSDHELHISNKNIEKKKKKKKKKNGGKRA